MHRGCYFPEELFETSSSMRDESPSPAPLMNQPEAAISSSSSNKLYQRSMQYAVMKKKARKLHVNEDLSFANSTRRSTSSSSSKNSSMLIKASVSSGEDELYHLMAPPARNMENIIKTPSSYVQKLYGRGPRHGFGGATLQLDEQEALKASKFLSTVNAPSDEEDEDNDEQKDDYSVQSSGSNRSSDTTGATMFDFSKENASQPYANGRKIDKTQTTKQVYPKSTKPIVSRGSLNGGMLDRVNNAQSRTNNSSKINVESTKPSHKSLLASRDLFRSKITKAKHIRQLEEAESLMLGGDAAVIAVDEPPRTPDRVNIGADRGNGMYHSSPRSVVNIMSAKDEHDGNHNITSKASPSQVVAGACAMGPFLAELNRMLTGPCMAAGLDHTSRTGLDLGTFDDDDDDDNIILAPPNTPSSNTLAPQRKHSTMAKGECHAAPVVRSDSLVRTHEELMRLKRELKWMKSIKMKKRLQIAAASSKANQAATGKKQVRFAKQLVTQVHHRPYTREEDIEKLYFVEEELEGYEYDRATTAPEQFEVIAKSHGNSMINWMSRGAKVQVEYKDRRRVCRDDQDDDDSLLPWELVSSQMQQHKKGSSDLPTLRE
ncbi:hypothetical protein MPSEU_000464300 [Mayamaea pseudoterrestris]|nr:hypothetical protein MPSEU_000464300 [Mayamaea pseudoterrestris]